MAKDLGDIEISLDEEITGQWAVPEEGGPTSAPLDDVDEELDNLLAGDGGKKEEYIGEALPVESTEPETVIADEPEVPTVFAPDDPEAPPLVISPEEPAAVPSAQAKGIDQDSTLETLKRLADGNADPAKARVALIAALSGQEYDIRDLPDARIIALGVANALVRFGTPVEDMADQILEMMPK